MVSEYPRISFNERLDEIKDVLEEMGSTTLITYNTAVEILFNYDEELVKEVNENSEKIDKLNNLLEDKTMSTIAAEQPVAKDLRFLESSLKVGTHLKRMGNLAMNIAGVAKHLEDGDVPEKPMDDIKKMTSIVEQMVGKSIKSFLNKDMELARELHRTDDEVDDLFDTTLDDTTKAMFEDKESINSMVSLIFTARFLERIADRSESIGNRTIFMITCEKPDLTI